jgi:hypothetical protein
LSTKRSDFERARAKAFASIPTESQVLALLRQLEGLASLTIFFQPEVIGQPSDAAVAVLAVEAARLGSVINDLPSASMSSLASDCMGLARSAGLLGRRARGCNHGSRAGVDHDRAPRPRLPSRGVTHARCLKRQLSLRSVLKVASAPLFRE